MDRKKLVNLAERYLNQKGQEDIRWYLEVKAIRIAQVFLLGALDKLLEGGKVSAEELAEAYRDLGLKPEEIADIRNRLSQY